MSKIVAGLSQRKSWLIIALSVGVMVAALAGRSMAQVDPFATAGQAAGNRSAPTDVRPPAPTRPAARPASPPVANYSRREGEPTLEQAAHAAEVKAEAGRKAIEGCRAGYWVDCVRVDEFVPAGSPEILEAGLKGCSLENRGSCAEAAYFYEKYSNAPDHMALAVKFYKKACDEGLEKSCTRLADNSLGAASAGAMIDILHSNEKQCTSGDFAACNWLGIAYANGQIVPTNKDKSFQYFDRACKLGNKTSCENNAEDYRRNAERDAHNDPKRKPGAALSKIDADCLKESQHDTFVSTGRVCIKTIRYPTGQSECGQYQYNSAREVQTTVENICKRPVSAQEYCGAGKPTWFTLLPGETFDRTKGECRLAY